MKLNFEETINIVQRQLDVSIEEAGKIVEKAHIGQEFSTVVESLTWVNDRFLPNCVLIDEDGYTKMCIDALKILDRTAATDYGSSRQRDLGQLWADMTRGYLGEFAFQLFMKKHWNLESELGHEVGSLDEFLPLDIHNIRRDGGVFHAPSLKLSVKTTKWNGIWLDIPGDQFNHSDIHILIKVGTGRDHLFAFFKKISVFKDKILKKGVDSGCLTCDESDALFENLPSFKPVPAYICGFVKTDRIYEPLSYAGKSGKKNYTIQSWNGPISSGDLDRIKDREHVSGDIKFEGIGKFSHDSGYLFNTGSLLWNHNDWTKVVNRL